MENERAKGNGRTGDEMDILLGRLYLAQDTWGSGSPAAARIEEALEEQGRFEDDLAALGGVVMLQRRRVRYNDVIHGMKERIKQNPGEAREYSSRIMRVLEMQLWNEIAAHGGEQIIRDTWKGILRYASRAKTRVDPSLEQVYREVRMAYALERPAIYGRSSQLSADAWKEIDAICVNKKY